MHICLFNDKWFDEMVTQYRESPPHVTQMVGAFAIAQSIERLADQIESIRAEMEEARQDHD